MRLDITEHSYKTVITLAEDLSNQEAFNEYCNIKPRSFVNKRGQQIPYYKLDLVNNDLAVKADYYVGIDWIIPQKKYVFVAPKVNTKLSQKFDNETEDENIELNNNTVTDLNPDPNFQELNYLSMLLKAIEHPEISKHCDRLLFVDWESEEIPIKQQQDALTPFLMVQFLNLLKQIVRKGLKKSYYKIQENLINRVKGKILVSQHIRQNVFKNNLTKTYCEYQVFDIDSIENRFLKKVLLFVQQYLNNSNSFLQNDLQALYDLINYCMPSFTNVSSEISDHELKNIKFNPFFIEYREAIKMGKFILERFAYNISNVAKETVSTPPFWIDMPRLFELYTFNQLLKGFQPNEIHYHYTTYGNELDFLIIKDGYEMVIDCKYKLRYSSSQIHDDIRQVSGYARLNKVYNELGINENEIVDCMIIYPDLINGNLIINFEEKQKIKAYNSMYKLGLKLPTLTQ